MKYLFIILLIASISFADRPETAKTAAEIAVKETGGIPLLELWRSQVTLEDWYVKAGLGGIFHALSNEQDFPLLGKDRVLRHENLVVEFLGSIFGVKLALEKRRPRSGIFVSYSQFVEFNHAGAYPIAFFYHPVRNQIEITQLWENKMMGEAGFSGYSTLTWLLVLRSQGLALANGKRYPGDRIVFEGQTLDQIDFGNVKDLIPKIRNRTLIMTSQGSSLAKDNPLTLEIPFSYSQLREIAHYFMFLVYHRDLSANRLRDFPEALRRLEMRDMGRLTYGTRMKEFKHFCSMGGKAIRAVIAQIKCAPHLAYPELAEGE